MTSVNDVQLPFDGYQAPGATVQCVALGRALETPRPALRLTVPPTKFVLIHMVVARSLHASTSILRPVILNVIR
jgi:hypothetical protein